MSMSHRQLSLFVVEFDTDNVPDRETSRTIVKNTLSDFLDKKSTTLIYDDLGKPSVVNENDLVISYAHSKTCIVIAANHSSTALGVDTESVTRLSNIIELKDIAFSASELKSFDEKNYVFRWCLKEAAVKQLGTGFRNADPSQFSMQIEGKSYKISLDGNEIFQGYFLDLCVGENIVVLCFDSPITKLSLNYKHLRNLTGGST